MLLGLDMGEASDLEIDLEQSYMTLRNHPTVGQSGQKVMDFSLVL